MALVVAVDDYYRREGAERGGWSFTALYSNTARAHALGRTHDWVVVFCERDGVERQCTVVTELSGPLKPVGPRERSSIEAPERASSSRPGHSEVDARSAEIGAVPRPLLTQHGHQPETKELPCTRPPCGG